LGSTAVDVGELVAGGEVGADDWVTVGSNEGAELACAVGATVGFTVVVGSNVPRAVGAVEDWIDGADDGTKVGDVEVGESVIETVPAALGGAFCASSKPTLLLLLEDESPPFLLPAKIPAVTPMMARAHTAIPNTTVLRCTLGLLHVPSVVSAIVGRSVGRYKVQTEVYGKNDGYADERAQETRKPGRGACNAEVQDPHQSRCAPSRPPFIRNLDFVVTWQDYLAKFGAQNSCTGDPHLTPRTGQ